MPNNINPSSTIHCKHKFKWEQNTFLKIPLNGKTMMHEINVIGKMGSVEPIRNEKW